MSSDQFSAQLPSRDSKAGNDDYTLTVEWYNFMVFLASLTAAPFEQFTNEGLTPFTWQASKIGHLHVVAGAASSVVLQRGGILLACPTSGFIPVVAGDEINISPNNPDMTFTFVPTART